MIMRLNRPKDGFASAPGAIDFDAAFRARLRDLLLWRRDVRRFRPDPLPKDTLESLIELACLAPSVGLSQPWRFVIVEDAARRPLRATQARRACRSPGPFRGVCGSRHRARPRTWPPHHAGNDRVFGGHGGAYDLACRAGAGNRSGMDFD